MPEPNILSYYEPGGISRTEVKGTFPVIEPMTARDQLMALIDNESRALPRKPLTPLSRKTSSPMATRTVTVRPQRQGPTSERNYVDPLAALKARDQYEATIRAAAMRPTGLGAQMIPGMAVDPHLLPSHMRPASSNFQNLAGPSAAGLDDAPVRPQAPGSNAGFDYLPASEQARWLAAYGRR